MYWELVGSQCWATSVFCFLFCFCFVLFCFVFLFLLFFLCGYTCQFFTRIKENCQSGRLTLLMKMQRYLDIHTPPLSWICDHARLLVENGCNVLWLHGSACGRPQCPGLRFQQTPKNETSTLFAKGASTMYRLEVVRLRNLPTAAFCTSA